MTNQNKPLRIDIVSDVMCPWCVIGYCQLAIALEETGINYEIHWQPFELNPNMPETGQDMQEHLVEKYGTTPEQSDANRANMTAQGKELGFTFNLKAGFRMHNTFNTHQLLHWANTLDRKDDLKQALFYAHFTKGRDLSDVMILADIATEIGLGRAEAVAVLFSQRFASEVRKEQKIWTRQGISGVPTVVFDSQHLITGAQGVNNYKNILNQIQGIRG